MTLSIPVYPILSSDPDPGLPLVRAIIRIRVPLVIFNHAQLRGLLGYIFIPGAALYLSLISEDNYCAKYGPFACNLG